ncbi:MAG: ClpXP protease specificity-enhancing factor [Burkholderiaceae bacterium]
MIDAQNSSSTRPYLIRALYEWCTDNGFTPYVAVRVDDTVQVPREYVKDGEIVLNISFDATSSLKLGNEFIEFNARFAGSAREIMVPVDRVIAIYARENGQGMAFPPPPPAAGHRVDATQTVKTSPSGGAQAGLAEADLKLLKLTKSPPSASDETPPEPPSPGSGAGPKARPNLTRVK